MAATDPSGEQLTMIIAMTRGAISALAADVRVLPPKSLTYRRTMPHLRRAAGELGMGAEAVGDEPDWAAVRRGIAQLQNALREAEQGAERFIAANESTARALMPGYQGGQLNAMILRQMGTTLRGTANRIRAELARQMALLQQGAVNLATGIGGGIGVVLALLAVVFVISKRV